MLVIIMYENLFDCNRQYEMRSFFLEHFSRYGERKVFNKNEEIKIEYGKSIAVVTKGKILKTIYNKEGSQKSLYFLIPGEILGDEEYFEGREELFLAIAKEVSEISILNQKAVENLLDSNPQIYRFFIHSIMRKYRIALMQMANMYFSSSTQKVADILLRLYAQLKTPDNFTNIISLPFTHQELADFVGCSRITVTKSLNELKAQNIINMCNKKIIIKDMEKLKVYAADISKSGR